MLKVALVVAVLALALYLGIRLLQTRGNDDPGRTATRRPIAPDDDPEFLRDLDRKRRQRGETDS